MSGGLVVANEALKAQPATGSKRRKQETPTKCNHEIIHQMSYIDQNGYKNDQLKSDRDNCSMCLLNSKHGNNKLVDLCHNESMKDIVKNQWHIPQKNIDNWLSCACVQCIFKINAHKELTMSIQSRLRTLSVDMNQQARLPKIQKHQEQLIVAPPTPDTSPNNFLVASTLEVDDTHVQTTVVVSDITTNIKTTTTITTTTAALLKNLNSDKCSSPSTAVTNSCQQVLQTSPVTSKSSSPQRQTTDHYSSMLEVFQERPVSPLNTESGGGGHGGKQDYVRVPKTPEPLYCPNCNRKYFLKYFYTKHVRRCRMRPSAKSVASTHSTNINQLDAMDDERRHNYRIANCQSMPTERLTNFNTPSKVFQCSICAVTVDNVIKLREHKRIHMQRYYCNVCGKEFVSPNEFEFHYVICAATQEAKLTMNEDSNPSTITCSPNKRMTRSRSNLPSVSPSKASSLAAATNVKEVRQRKNIVPNRKRKQHTKKQQAIIPAAVQTRRNVGGESNSSELGFTLTQSYRDRLELMEAAENGYELDDCEYADSIPDTMYQRRLSLTGQWVEEHSNSHSAASMYDDNIFDYPYDFADDQITTYKEYDLYLLDRLKAEILLSYFTCTTPSCSFVTDTLPKLMLHDYLEHFKNSWYYCRKCGDCFTSKVFLDYHLDRQNYGRYVCYKCGDIFDYQHQLQRHIIRHSKRVNYHCKYCNFEFLTENELLEHCANENHDPNTERKLITIDPLMTITNPTIAEPILSRSNLQSQINILNMKLPPTPSKRCISLETYSRYLPEHLQNPYLRLRIGDVEFKNQRNPNCWGWT